MFNESNDPVKYVGLDDYKPTKTAPYHLLQDIQNEQWKHHTLDIFLGVIYFNHTQAIYEHSTLPETNIAT